MNYETRTKLYGWLEECNHPIFGPGFGRGNDSTPDEAFEDGKGSEKNKEKYINI